MQDRFTRGVFAGLIAGVPTMTFNLSMFYLGLSSVRWADFMGILTFGRMPVGVGEIVFTVIAVYIFVAFSGAVYAYALLLVSSANYWLKGWMFALAIWFTSFAIALLFRIPRLSDASLNDVLFNFFGASIWGLTLGFSLNWLDNRVRA